MPNLLPYVQAACTGHPQKTALQAKLTDEATALQLVQGCLTGSYNQGRVGARVLQIPDQNLRLAHRVLHLVLSPLLPPAQGVHGIADEIQGLVGQYPFYIRTDIAKCFPSVQKAPAMASLNTFLNQQGWVDQSPQGTMLRQVAESAFHGTGLSTGSPASPLLLETLFRVFPQGTPLGNSKFIRYVDDVLVLQKEPQPKALEVIEQAIAPLGLRLNPAKTQQGETKDGFAYLGRIFGNTHIKSGADTFYIDATQFFPLKHWRPKLGLTADAAAPGYDSSNGVTTLRLDTLFDHFSKGSLDALALLACVGQVPDLRDFADNRDLFLGQEFAHPCHSKLYSGYIANVKNPRDLKQGRVDPIMAEKLICCLAVSTYLQKHGQFPDSIQDIDKSMGTDLAQGLANATTGTGAYHTEMKKLFKLEYQLRIGGKSVLPKTAPILGLAEPPTLAGLLQPIPNDGAKPAQGVAQDI